MEWNQCPYGKTKENPNLPFEIVEIGAIKLNENREITGHFSETIRPQVYRRFHYRTQEILHMDMEELKDARTFPQVISDFFSWCGEDAQFCTWGSLDLVELLMEAEEEWLITIDEDEIKNFKTVGDVVRYIEDNM